MYDRCIVLSGYTGLSASDLVIGVVAASASDEAATGAVQCCDHRMSVATDCDWYDMILQFRFVGTVGVTIKSSIVCVAESTLCGTVIKAFKCDTWLRAR